MTVLHLAPSGAALTAHSFIDEEIVALQAAGLQCHVVSDTPAGRTTLDGVVVHRMPSAGAPRDLVGPLRAMHALPPSVVLARWRSPRELSHALRIEAWAAELVRRARIDVIHSHFGWPAGLGGAAAARLAGVPLVASLRGMDLLVEPAMGYGLRRDRAYDCAVRRLLASATRTVYATEFMRQEGLRAGAEPGRARLVRKGVDVTRFRPSSGCGDIRRALGVEGVMVLAVGTLTARKGHAPLLRALGAIADQPWTLVICGTGPERDSLESLAASLGIAGRVRFAGQIGREAIPGYFAAAEVFVHTAAIEAAGNVILEALASGCAVVSTRSGGPDEYVRDGDTGLLVAAGDERALAAALRAVVQQKELRERLAGAARIDARRRFDYDRMIADLIEVYGEAVAAGRSGGNEPAYRSRART